MPDAKPGARYQCAECGTQVVVIRADGTSPRCCGADMEPVAAGKAAAS